MSELFYDILNNATLEDCEDMCAKKGKHVVINDGKVKGFIKENED